MQASRPLLNEVSTRYDQIKVTLLGEPDPSGDPEGIAGVRVFDAPPIRRAPGETHAQRAWMWHMIQG